MDMALDLIMKKAIRFLSSEKTTKKLKDMAYFFIVFGLFSLPVLATLDSAESGALEVGIAGIVSSLMGIFGVQNTVEGAFVTFALKEGGMFTLRIITPCNGLASILLFSGLVFGTAGIPLKRKLLGILVGGPLIFGINILRLSSINVATHYLGLRFFDTFHVLLWRELLIAIILVMWLAWMKYAEASRPFPRDFWPQAKKAETLKSIG